RDAVVMRNAGFVPVASDDRMLVLETYGRQGDSIPLWPPGSGTQSEIQEAPISDVYADFKIDVVEADGELLPDAQAIVNASIAGDQLLARTTLREGPYTAVIEYPVKTMNANERDWIYQTDTGP